MFSSSDNQGASLQVPHIAVFSMEAKRHVCYMHVDSAIAPSCQQSGFSVRLCSRVLYRISGKKELLFACMN